MPRRKPLLVDVGIVGAVQVLDKDLVALDKDTGVPARDSSFVSAVVGQVDFGKDVADRILSTDDDLGPARRKRYGAVGALRDQAAPDSGSG